MIVEAPVLDELTLKDAGDRRLVEAAHTAGARYLVTADREVLRMRGYGAVEFVTAGEFLQSTLGARRLTVPAGAPTVRGPEEAADDTQPAGEIPS